MELTNIFSLLGGLALFLYGMTMMSNGLELAAGNKMKSILEKLTTNRFLGVLEVGALNYSDYSIIFSNNSHGCRICECRIDAINKCCMGDYGS